MLTLRSSDHIFIGARRVAVAEEFTKSVQQTTPKAKFTVVQLDLASFDSIRNCARELNRLTDRLDIVFLNAGIAGLSPSLTKEGYEQHFGVNHIGHAYLMQLILPKMLETRRQHADADLRIHVTSSMGGVNFVPATGLALEEMKKPDPFPYNLTRYGHSKLANILFARKLAQEYPFISCTSSHPGTVKSDIWGKADGSPWVSALFAPIVWFTGVTNEEGAKTQLWCATAPTVDIQNGQFYFPTGKLYGEEKSKYLRNPQLVEDLWDWTNDELSKHGAPGWAKA